MDDTTLDQLLSEEEIRQQMSEITRRYPIERAALRAAFDGLSKAEAKAQLAVTFFEPDILTNEDAKKWLTRARTEGTKLLAADKEAIVLLEVQEKKIAHDLCKFDCDTSDKQFAKLESQQSYNQSLMKFTGVKEGEVRSPKP
jgi:hypothetical protein